LLRLGRRLAFALVAACALGFVLVQFSGIVAKNVAMARSVSDAQTEIASLERRAREQQRTLRRLETPEGAIPEIHAKLRLVGPHEEIIYVHDGANRPNPDGS
jgi:septal ring factor EnvC (AmiA/AmiB activator)